MVGRSRLSHPAMADQFSVPWAELAGNEFCNRKRASWKSHRAVHNLDLRLGKSKKVNGHFAQLLVDVLAGASDGAAHKHRRSARRRLQVERHNSSVPHDDRY